MNIINGYLQGLKYVVPAFVLVNGVNEILDKNATPQSFTLGAIFTTGMAVWYPVSVPVMVYCLVTGQSFVGAVSFEYNKKD